MRGLPFSFWKTPSTTLDGDAREFIKNWELNTNVIMPLTQRMAINDFYRGMKGEGTTNGTNLLAIAKANGTKIFPQIPLTDTTANAAAYSLDAVSNGVFKGTYINMVAGDFTQNGVTGGAGTKYFNPSINMYDDYGLEASFGYYGRTPHEGSSIAMGQNPNHYLFTPSTAVSITCRLGFGGNNCNITSTDGTGFIGVTRNQNTIRSIQNFGFRATVNSAFIVDASPTFTIHAYRGASHFTKRQMCFYWAGLKNLNQNELDDFYTIVQRLQSNVIPAGRQIGFYVPPIDNVIYDINALAFISAHETSTGVPMGLTQKLAIQGFVLRLKGQFTTNGTNIWTTARANGGRLWPLCPIDDTTANADAYRVELITANPLGDYVNFTPGDITPTGAVGGAGKYFDTNTNYRQVNADLSTISVYARTHDTTNFRTYIGAAARNSNNAFYASLIRRQDSDTRMGYSINSAVDVAITPSQAVGLLTAQRFAVGNHRFFYNGVQIDSKTRSRIVSMIPNTYAHALNDRDTLVSENTSELALYCTNWRNMTDEGTADFNEAIQWYQTNVITGGRNV